MRDGEDVARARAALIRQLGRQDIGKSHQRALLHGMLAALDWCQGASSGNAKALQRLVGGEEIAADNGALIGGSPSARAVGRSQRPDLVRRYQLQTGDVDLVGYVAWLESQITGVGLVVT